jgi:hypothetical protein
MLEVLIKSDNRDWWDYLFTKKLFPPPFYEREREMRNGVIVHRESRIDNLEFKWAPLERTIGL